MSNEVQALGTRARRMAGALHVDVRGLACPEPLTIVLRLIDSGEAGTSMLVRLNQEPLLLYPELDARGWRHRLVAPDGSAPAADDVLIELRPGRT